MAPLPCPRCGALMNRHAEKLVTGPDAESSDPVFDGVIEEQHLCPTCHWIVSRRLPAP